MHVQVKGTVILTIPFYDINLEIKKKNPKFQLIPIYDYKLCIIILVDETLCKKWLSFHKEMISA